MACRFIPSAHTGVLQLFGRFVELKHPGLNFYVPVMSRISVVSNMVQHKDFRTRVKTRDNVFTDLNIGVQLQIKPDDTEKAFFSLERPDAQIDSYVQNVVRSYVPKMTLDQLFASQGDIGNAVGEQLSAKMADYGYTIVDTLVNDISPASEVRDAMNAINAAERMKEAARNEADASYIRKVKDAEADRDRKILQGQGISGQRKAILDGYRSGVDEMATKLGLSPQEVVAFVLATQKMDMLETIGRSSNAKTVFLDHSSNSFSDRAAQAIMSAREVSSNYNPHSLSNQLEDTNTEAA